VRPERHIDLADLRPRPSSTRRQLAALMVTYPSTHGVFEEGVRGSARSSTTHGGQVYMDGANMNAQVGLAARATSAPTSAT
jgi:glycine dehydrogenase